MWGAVWSPETITDVLDFTLDESGEFELVEEIKRNGRLQSSGFQCRYADHDYKHGTRYVEWGAIGELGYGPPPEWPPPHYIPKTPFPFDWLPPQRWEPSKREIAQQKVVREKREGTYKPKWKKAHVTPKSCINHMHLDAIADFNGYPICCGCWDSLWSEIDYAYQEHEREPQ